MGTKENMLQTVSERQNEVMTEGFVADFALIDSTIIQKRSVLDIVNENLSSLTTFF